MTSRKLRLNIKSKVFRVRIKALLFILLSMFLMKQAYFFHFIKERTFQNKDLFIINDIVSKIEIYDPAKGPSTVTLTLLKNTSFKYLLNGNAYRSTYVSWFLETVKEGDSIAIHVSKKEYLSQLAKLKNYTQKNRLSSFWNKIHIYGLEAHSNEYLIRKDFNRDEGIEVFVHAWLFTIVSLLMFLLAMGAFIYPEPDNTV